MNHFLSIPPETVLLLNQSTQGRELQKESEKSDMAQGQVRRSGLYHLPAMRTPTPIQRGLADSEEIRI